MESNIVFQSAPNVGVNFHRVLLPANWISHLSNSRIPILDGPLIPQVLNDISHVVFNSKITPVPGEQEKVFKQYTKAGVRTILDLDDYWMIEGSYSRFADEDQEQYKKDVIYCIKNSDMVFCASKKLAQEVKKLNKNTHYIPNTLIPQEEARGSVKNLGIFGTIADHQEDFHLIKSTLERVNKIPGVEFLFWAGAESTKQNDLILNPFRKSQKPYTIARISEPNDYLKQFRNCTMVLAPMVERPFNNYRSCIRAIEAGAYGCTFIGSKAEPYQEIIKHEVNGLLTEKKVDWFNFMVRLARNPGFCKDLSAQLQEDIVKEFNPNKWQTVRFDLIKTLK